MLSCSGQRAVSPPSSFFASGQGRVVSHSRWFRWAFPASQWHLLSVNGPMSAVHCVLCRAELPCVKARLPGQQRRMAVWIKAPGSAMSKGGEGEASRSSWADLFQAKWRSLKRCTKTNEGSRDVLCEKSRTMSSEAVLYSRIFFCSSVTFGGGCMLVSLWCEI